MPRRLRRLTERRLQDLQLLRLDGRPWPPPLGPPVAVVGGLVLGLRVPRLRVAVQGTLGGEEKQLNATMWSGVWFGGLGW